MISAQQYLVKEDRQITRKAAIRGSHKNVITNYHCGNNSHGCVPASRALMSGNSSNNGDGGNSSHNINNSSESNTMKSQNKEFGRTVMTVRTVNSTVHFDLPAGYYSERILQLQYYPWESSPVVLLLNSKYRQGRADTYRPQ